MPGERFRVRIASEDGGSSDRVVVEVGMEGFNIYNNHETRLLEKYPLHHISRWSMRGTSLVLFTKQPSEIEDRTVVLEGDESTIRSVLDTLTSACMQTAELLQQRQSEADRSAASSLSALLHKSRRPQLPTADRVEFWHHPEKAGWMQSQGEHIPTWRRRWFVLKQGFLFRFSSPDVTAASKPRGVLDLSRVTDVCEGLPQTGRPNSLLVHTASGSVSYLCDSETALVEWCSALEGAVQRIVKIVAGLEDELPPAGRSQPRGRAAAAGADDWVAQLQERMDRASKGGGAAGATRRAEPGPRVQQPRDSDTIRIVNYAPSAAEPALDARSVSGAAPVPSQAEGRGLYPAAQAWGAEAYGRAPSYAGPASPGYQAGAQGAQGGRAAGGQAYQGAGGYQGGSGGQAHPSFQGGSGGQAYPFFQGAAYPAGSYAAAQPAYAPAAAAPQAQAASYEGPQRAQGHLMDRATAPAAASPAPEAGPWQTHRTPEGRPYYYNAVTGITQWNAPAG